MFIGLYIQCFGRLLMRTGGALNLEISQLGKFVLGSTEAMNSNLTLLDLCAFSIGPRLYTH